MGVVDSGDETATAAAWTDDDDDGDDDEPPEDAVECPLYEGGHQQDCPICHGQRWTTAEAIEAYLGPNRVPCLFCGGDGVESGGPMTSTCPYCLDTGMMPASALDDDPPREDPLEESDWSGADLQGKSLKGRVFTSSDFSRVNFDGANLARVVFASCQFQGANPERARSLRGARFLIDGLDEAGLSPEQWDALLARGAIGIDEAVSTD
jgi:Pentapeptide repeats (8 copies)